ncbi:SRPBCC family protein [Halomicrobium salinisoli]|uniref:SRPBCC family protein n=1 Tax=Halomicrobium salinisoli TaxID=2878391 RepID=UPI001CF081DA|nr:SRPBCC family protein [Halomicrobium salinisoli]
MTVRVEREITVPAPPDRVWEFIADPDRRAEPISVIDEWEVHDDGSATWYLSLPIPVIDSRIAIETRDQERRAPEYVRFTGTSRVMHVQGEHELEPDGEGGTRLTNRFVVEGRLPGVERFFKRNFDRELDALDAALRSDIESQP